ncbi:hypothetical protein BY458DRAFT_505960 [Sporodiniella umbellata]|nr:hypothetical protein BY458DRAFT_505960 [Sporodiniella umbellata]
MARYRVGEEYKTLSYAQVDRLSTYLACGLWACVQSAEGTLSFLGASGVDYMLWVLALFKLRQRFLLMSPRNSKAANADLIQSTGTTLWIVMACYETMARSTVVAEERVSIQVVQPLDLPHLLDQPPHPLLYQLDTSALDQNINESVLLLHSSGTTRFPQPIECSNRYLFYLPTFYEAARAQNNNPDVFNHQDVLLACAPLFHAFGMACMLNGLTAGASLIFIETATPSPQDIQDALVKNKATLLLLPPILLEGMIPFLKETQDFEAMQRLKWVVLGSAPLNQQVGQWFQSQKINVLNAFGGTEMGKIMAADLAGGENWYALRPLMADEHGLPYCAFKPLYPGVFHLYLRPGYPHLAINVANRPDGGYNTNDLYTQDPTYPDCYNFYGRLDDLLLLQNGEKVNPIPIEMALRQSPFVKQAAVIGHRQQCTAALIEIDLAYAVHHDPRAILQGVQTAVDRANQESANFGTLLPQMVKILPLDSHLPCTEKGSLKRKQVLLEYETLIHTLYQDLMHPPQLSPHTSLETIIAQVLDVSPLPPTTSLFDLGLNSLKAVQLRHLLCQSFGPLSTHFVYDHPSLAELEHALFSGGEKKDLTQLLMHSYLERAKSEFSPLTPSHRVYRVVLLTGVTGSLGAFVLRDLLREDRIEKVYCVVRGQDPRARLVHAFQSRALDPQLLDTERVEILNLTLDAPYLGLSLERYLTLKATVDVVQHCAWRVDFNMNLEHYDKTCIAPFYNLVRFAYNPYRPIHLHFVSSISASANLGPRVPEQPMPLDVRAPMAMGYAQSKFICEVLLDYLVREKGMPCTVQRLGQVCGDSLHGVWNTLEQFPLIMAGGAMMRKMPLLDTVLDWIPVDSASAVITDLILCHSKAKSVYHIVNPKTYSWHHLLDIMQACGIQFTTVSPHRWLQALAAQESNPAYRLLNHFQNTFHSGMKMPVWETTLTENHSQALHNIPALDHHLFAKYFDHWRGKKSVFI